MVDSEIVYLCLQISTIKGNMIVDYDIDLNTCNEKDYYDSILEGSLLFVSNFSLKVTSAKKLFFVIK